MRKINQIEVLSCHVGKAILNVYTIIKKTLLLNVFIGWKWQRLKDGYIKSVKVAS